MKKVILIITVAGLIFMLTGAFFGTAIAESETRRAQKILANIPAAHRSTVWEVMRHNNISLKEGMIDVMPAAVPSHSLDAGDTVMDIYFDTHPPEHLEISKEARTGLHAKFIKRKGSKTWVPANAWAKGLVEDKMPWKGE